MVAALLNFTPYKRALTLITALCLSIPGTAGAYHQGDSLKMNFGTFQVYGSYTKRYCSGQANLVSQQGHKVGASIYWNVGKTLYLLVSHPQIGSVQGRQKVRFLFPDGQKVTFPMNRHNDQLQVPVGIGPRGVAFYNAVMANTRVTVELTGVNDTVEVDLKDRDKAEKGAIYCREWLHG